LRSSRNINRRFILKIDSGVAEAFGAAAGVGNGVVVTGTDTPQASLIARITPAISAATSAPKASLSVGKPRAAQADIAGNAKAMKTRMACLLSDNPFVLLIFYHCRYLL